MLGKKKKKKEPTAAKRETTGRLTTRRLKIKSNNIPQKGIEIIESMTVTLESYQDKPARSGLARARQRSWEHLPSSTSPMGSMSEQRHGLAVLTGDLVSHHTLRSAGMSIYLRTLTNQDKYCYHPLSMWSERYQSEQGLFVMGTRRTREGTIPCFFLQSDWSPGERREQKRILGVLAGTFL